MEFTEEQRREVERRLLARTMESEDPRQEYGGTRCRNCSYSRNRNGYTKLNINGKNMLSHRVSYMLHYGIDPGALLVCHHCDNKICVNPKHLFLGTQLDNIKDRDNKGRQIKGDRHFSRTHPEKLARGDRSGARTHPEKLNPPRGDKHYARLHPEKSARGEKSGQSKLTEEHVRYIRMWASLGYSQQSIANAFHVAQTNIWHIVNRKTWKHIE